MVSECDIHSADALNEKLAMQVIEKTSKKHGRIDMALINAGGVIAQTNSLAGFQGLPLTVAYSGVKSAARLFFDGPESSLRSIRFDWLLYA